MRLREKLITGILILISKYKHSFREYNFIHIGSHAIQTQSQKKKAERDTNIKDINTIPRYIHYINFLIILVGTTSSLTPML